MKPSFRQIVYATLHAKRYRVKAVFHVAPRYRRDAKGRFIGGVERKGYTRRLLDRKAPMVTNMELMGENISANNALLARLMNQSIRA